MIAPVTVAEVSAETDIDIEPDLPWHIMPEPGSVAMQLRTTQPRVMAGSSIARRPDILAAARALPGEPVVVTSRSAGTFVLGGASWLGISALGALLPGQATPLDWMVRSLRTWFEAALASSGVAVTTGRVDGAWCPGFSDIAVDGRKLVGIGMRMTRAWIVVRGVVAISPMSDAEFATLSACHRLIGLAMRRDAGTSVAEITGAPSLAATSVIEKWRTVTTESAA